MRERRVLMIAHHFPPAGGSGSNRALAFARYLPRHCWSPTVLTPRPEWAMHRDDRLVLELPAQVRIVRTLSLEPRPTRPAVATIGSTAPSRPSRLRASVGHLKRFPDAHVGWLPFAFAAGRRERFDAMWSSSGPFTSHLVGWLLKRLLGKPWLVELRDGWYRWNRAIFPDYPWWRDALERRLEAMVIRSADRVILVTDRMRDAFRRQYPDLAAARFAVIPNGFDPDQFAPGLASAKTAGRWEVCHTGALYYGRSLAAFLQAVRQLIAAEPAFSREFRLTLVGTLDATARAELASAGLDTHISWIGQQDHASTIGQMRRADALLLIANTTQGAEATVPGKLFEYLAVGGPIVAIAPRISATADVLAQTGGAWLAEPDDPASIASALRRAYRDRVAPRDEAAVRRFDRRGLTRELACILDEVVERATRRL